MDKPARVQLSRAKGWRMPPDTVKVDRSTKWGNPYPVDAKRTAPMAVAAFRLHILACPALREMASRELRGKNLACWCQPGEPCHADVLLEIANG
ncbi:DUF4326 domain-containing protein [Sphingobium sp. JS3065]|uniref:DUF4326 domain-containing protein n=1 Tax=Sphingobium sp. JS3065 TaxID=2970925 RepID=UPI0022647D8F|nr:DUF4326 domain-containing protein [Sphingobium sp. JS3065]UZW55519.1 DUF4326 domain-containing protein [Sphingobium sp. JS3065]